MTNKAFIDKLAKAMGIDGAEAQTGVNTISMLLAEGLKQGDSVSVQGFGAFEAKQKAERKMFNPTTKSYNIVPAKTTIGFKMSATLKEKINE